MQIKDTEDTSTSKKKQNHAYSTHICASPPEYKDDMNYDKPNDIPNLNHTLTISSNRQNKGFAHGEDNTSQLYENVKNGAACTDKYENLLDNIRSQD